MAIYLENLRKQLASPLIYTYNNYIQIFLVETVIAILIVLSITTAIYQVYKF